MHTIVHSELKGMGRKLGEAKRQRQRVRQEQLKMEDRVSYLVKEGHRTSREVERANKLLQDELSKRKRMIEDRLAKQRHQDMLQRELERHALQNEIRRKRHRDTLSARQDEIASYCRNSYRGQKEHSQELKQRRISQMEREMNSRWSVVSSLRDEGQAGKQKVESFWLQRSKQAAHRYSHTIEAQRSQITRAEHKKQQLGMREQELISRLRVSRLQHLQLKQKIKQLKSIPDSQLEEELLGLKEQVKG